MTQVILSNWPFEKGVMANLYWVKSLRRIGPGRWNVSLVFRDKDGTMEEYETSWGSLPNFRLGEFYVDGQLLSKPVNGVFKVLDIPDASKYEIVSAKDIPNTLYKLMDYDNWKEQSLKYTSDDSVIYIPCFEVVRSLFTPKRFLADALLYPQGLEDLIEGSHEFYGNLHLDLSNGVPPNFLKMPDVRYLAWLAFNKNARRTWDKIYREIFNEERARQTNKPICLAVDMPLRGPIRLKVRALKYGDCILVLEIKSTTGLTLPYKNIEFHHESKDSVGTTNAGGSGENRHRNNKPQKEPETYLVTDGAPKKRKTNPVNVEREATSLFFEKDIPVKNVRFGTKITNRGNKKPVETFKGQDIENRDDDKPSDEMVSARAPEADGEYSEMEFLPVSAQTVGDTDGLENFLKALEVVRLLNRKVKIDTYVYELPVKYGFANLEDGRARNYALVRVDINYYKSLYLLEIGRPDLIQLSTLLFRARQNEFTNSELDDLVRKLLIELVDNKGYWNNDYLKRNPFAKFRKLHHMTNETPKEWGQRILNRLNSEAK